MFRIVRQVWIREMAKNDVKNTKKTNGKRWNL